MADSPSKPTPAKRFSQELLRHRKLRKLTQAALANQIPCSPSLIGHIEVGKRTPKYPFAVACDRILQPKQPGLFVALQKAIDEDPYAPDWFLEWLRIEPEAKVIRIWHPLLVPGLLQTEDYARAVFSGDVVSRAEKIEELVAARMQRQAILNKDEPPDIWALFDEGVLDRGRGGSAVMAAQLRHLIALVGLRHVRVQLVPIDTECTSGLMSGFVVAELPDGGRVVSVDSSGRGEVSADYDLVELITSRYDRLRAEAYRPAESLARIEEAAERWNRKI